MRVLVTTSPGTGHVFPTLSFAQAVKAAGHDVLYAMAGNTGAVVGAGLHVADAAPGFDFGQVFVENLALAQDGTVEGVLRLFAKVSEPVLDAVVAVGEQWRPDLVVHSPLQAAGPLLAAKLGVPAVCHNLSFAQLDDGFAQAFPVMSRELAVHYDKHGVYSPPETSLTLSVTPPEVHPSGQDTWPMRYVPYNGGGLVPDWLLAPTRRRRVAVTLGTVLPMMAGLGALQPFLAAAGEVDAEFVLALGDIDYATLGELPANVRPVGYLPLGLLLAQCDAAIHHGGAGTTMTTADSGVPQLVLPHGADQFLNAEVVRRTGTGLQVAPADLSAELLNRLLSDVDMRNAARLMRDRLHAMPSPAQVVRGLAELTSARG
ncbi:nucleotide disphospho-sugar-binding domain-containing protein [Kutzneria albida]|nr:nucleotide disphospho-sugar-binding domain-containing protein [Kutzneria albida]